MDFMNEQVNRLRPLKGIVPPVITPLIDDKTLDEEGVFKLVNHLLDGGVHGLFLLGTTGEATSVGYKLRENFVGQTCKIVNKKIPVLVGITDTSFEDSVEMAYRYKEAGADAVVIAPPYYIPISQKEMMIYLEDLAPKLPLPFLMYNMPGYTKLNMSVETVTHAHKLGALGIKDSSGDQFYLYSLIDKFKNDPGFSIITGTEIYIPETILFGGHGAVSGGANIFPRLYVDLYNASCARDLERIIALRKIVMRIYNTIYSVGKNASKYTLGVKCAVSAMGICNNYAAHPLRKFDHESEAQMKSFTEEIELLYLKIQNGIDVTI